VSDVVEVPLLDHDARKIELVPSKMRRREVFTKTLKGALMVRKLLLWETNKAAEAGNHRASTAERAGRGGWRGGVAHEQWSLTRSQRPKFAQATRIAAANNIALGRCPVSPTPETYAPGPCVAQRSISRRERYRAATNMATSGYAGRNVAYTAVMNQSTLPVIIQGGMGAGVSGWRLARAVCVAGQLGVVSGTAIDAIVARRLGAGDEGGHVRRALAHFPVPGIADRIIARYFVEGGKAESQPFTSKPMPSAEPSRAAEELVVASNFVEVWLARQGHDAPVGINFLEKIQAPTLASLYGAMLAGVSYVLMGAGIPRAIPGILDRLSRTEAVELKLDVAGAAPSDEFVTRFDPRAFWPEGPATLTRPRFLAVVSSVTLAGVLAKKASGRVDGFIIEGPTAGGHNAPPRGVLQLTAEGEPIYGERDVVDLQTIASLGLAFWLAGSCGDSSRLADALRHGAAGVQVGTAFAFCEESDLTDDIKRQVLELSGKGEARVFTDPRASPTGFPFKVLPMAGTLADPNAPERSARICDLGYLRQAYKAPDGKLGWRCAAEPVEKFIAKGGSEEETHGRLCVCNGLMANIGLGQVRGGAGNGCEHELPLVTSGDDVATVARFLKPGATSYSAAHVIEELLRGVDQNVRRGCDQVAV